MGNKKKDADIDIPDFIGGFIIGTVVAIVIMGICWGIGSSEIKEQLGGAICKESLGQEYISYNKETKELVCAPKEEIKNYNGLTIKTKLNNS